MNRTQLPRWSGASENQLANNHSYHLSIRASEYLILHTMYTKLTYRLSPPPKKKKNIYINNYNNNYNQTFSINNFQTCELT